ncbi:hypothetical protein [Lactobacillus sp. CBA3605] [Lactiplantibacillus mudanjiangensis]|uniref:PLD nuclease N-terminal domain-containing protein n=1 Tax=Lactiplantibacillus mudanjiangensis TaxID=1296538 RepID=UPI00101433C4|nr:hypothetical protein [Lactobacillus sp. CBA3605] [Lactiplantibacillus mudanjiangensis]
MLRHRHQKMKRPLSRQARQRLAPVVAFEVTATGIAVLDVLRARSFRRGHRLGWLLLAFVQPIGPWLYFMFGQSKDKS